MNSAKPFSEKAAELAATFFPNHEVVAKAGCVTVADYSIQCATDSTTLRHAVTGEQINRIAHGAHEMVRMASLSFSLTMIAARCAR